MSGDTKSFLTDSNIFSLAPNSPDLAHNYFSEVKKTYLTMTMCYTREID